MRPKRMRILVIGAAGMLGGKLVDRLVRDGCLGSQGISQLTLVDRVVAEPPGDPGFVVESTVADLAEPGAAGAIVAGRPDVIFHLAAVVSGEAEDDLEKGLVAEGEDPAYVMQQLGHTDPKMTLGLYAKALKSKRRRPHAQGVRAAGRALDPGANGHGTGTSGVELMAEALTTGSRSAAERTRRANQHAVAHIISTRGAGGTGTDLMVGAPSSRSSPSWRSSWGYTAAVSSMGGTWRPSMTGAGEWAPSPAAPPSVSSCPSSTRP